MKIASNKQVVVPPGEYVVGDPCYTVPDELWLDLLESCGYFGEMPVGKVEGVDVLAFHTAHGDGLFHDQNGNEYPVDAGLIGLVPVSSGWARDSSLTTTVRFLVPTICTERDGLLAFGPIEIQTDDWDDDYEDDDSYVYGEDEDEDY